MKKKINIDDYLVNQGVEITLGKKVFKVTDLPMDIKIELGKEDIDEKALVKKMLGCTDEDLEGYGLVAFAAIIREVTENLFRAPSLQNQ